MKKKIKNAVVCIALILLAAGAYRFFVYPKPYPYQVAANNGDVVTGPEGTANTGRFEAFLQKVAEKQPDRIRITAYSKEGRPTIRSLEYDGKTIKCITDRTGDRFGGAFFQTAGEYTKIEKSENDYFLVDESGNRREEWIFQE